MQLRESPITPFPFSAVPQELGSAPAPCHFTGSPVSRRGTYPKPPHNASVADIGRHQGCAGFEKEFCLCLATVSERKNAFSVTGYELSRNRASVAPERLQIIIVFGMMQVRGEDGTPLRGPEQVRSTPRLIPPTMRSGKRPRIDSGAVASQAFSFSRSYCTAFSAI